MPDATTTWPSPAVSSRATRSPRAEAAPSPAVAEPVDDEALFAEQMVALNLRHIGWICVVGLAVIAATSVLMRFLPLPGTREVDYSNGVIAACGVASLAAIRHFRQRSRSRRARERFVLMFTALLLGTMNAYFFNMLAVYGQTSIYVIGMAIVALLIRLPPRIFFPLLMTNHAVFLALLLSQDLDLAISVPAATDNSAMMMMAGLTGWLLHRAHRENFRKEHVILQRTAELRAQNVELARLHQLELDEKLAARLDEEKARLEVLRYQLNPHFLFNAFTSIRAQLPSTLVGARQTIEQLTDFCRLTLFRPENDEHPTLGSEFKLLRAYLDIEQTRWGELLAVEIDVAPEAEQRRIPSLLLLPLMENALKYGRVTQTGPMTVRLSAHLRADSLELVVANTGDWDDRPAACTPPSLGIGLENLRQRLARYYPDAHEFTTEARDGWVRARLVLRSPRSAVVTSA